MQKAKKYRKEDDFDVKYDSRHSDIVILKIYQIVLLFLVLAASQIHKLFYSYFCRFCRLIYKGFDLAKMGGFVFATN